MAPCEPVQSHAHSPVYLHGHRRLLKGQWKPIWSFSFYPESSSHFRIHRLRMFILIYSDECYQTAFIGLVIKVQVWKDNVTYLQYGRDAGAEGTQQKQCILVLRGRGPTTLTNKTWLVCNDLLFHLFVLLLETRSCGSGTGKPRAPASQGIAGVATSPVGVSSWTSPPQHLLCFYFHS